MLFKCSLAYDGFVLGVEAEIIEYGKPIGHERPKFSVDVRRIEYGNIDILPLLREKSFHPEGDLLLCAIEDKVSETYKATPENER